MTRKKAVVGRRAAPSSPPQTIREAIYRDVRRAIVLGRIRPTERLQAEVLAKRHKTSMTPVRDALQMLSNEGLIAIRPRLGYFVPQMSLGQLRDLLEMREILEGEAAERAAVRMSELDLDELEKVHAGYTGDDDESVERYMDENRRFHHGIALGSGNNELASSVGHVLDRLARYMVLYGEDEEMAANHAPIVTALRSRDPARAREALLAQLVHTRKWILEHIIDEQAGSWSLHP